MDTMDTLSSIFQGTMSSVASFVFSYFVIFIIVVIAIIAMYYTLTGFKWLFIGRKAGLDKDWMPFVPFAKTIYRLKIVEEQWWKMFFLEFWWLYSLIMYRIIDAISNGLWRTFAVILVTVFCGCCVAYNVYWRYKYYKAFNIKPNLSIWVTIPLSGGRRRAWDYQVAFTDNYEFTGEGLSRTVSSTAKSVVSVPRQGEAPRAAGGKGGGITGLSGMYAGQDLPLAANDEMIIGRDNAMCNLIVDQNAEKVSRRHCGITYDTARGMYQVTDYSTNGTFVEGGNRLVANMPTSLPRGTVIALGNRENRFKLN